MKYKIFKLIPQDYHFWYIHISSCYNFNLYIKLILKMKKSFLFFLCIIFFLLSFNAHTEQVYRNTDFQFRIDYPDNWTRKAK